MSTGYGRQAADLWKVTGITAAKEGEFNENLIFGFPTEAGALDRTSQREGPRAIRRAGWENPGQHFTGPWGDKVEGRDAGDIPLMNALDPQHFLALPYDFNRMLMMGGDHSATYYAVKHLQGKHPNLSLLVFDSHVDNEEGELNHETWLSHLDIGYHVISPFTTEFDVPDGPLYVSIDLDYISLGDAPGVGTPSPGGVTANEAFWRLSDVLGAAGENLVGVDVVELTPDHDLDGRTAHLARNLILTCCSHDRGT